MSFLASFLDRFLPVSPEQYIPAATIILLPNIGAGVIGIFCLDGIRNWSRTLRKPSFGPPSWLFSPAWFSIYICMGLSSYLVYKEGGQVLPLTVYGLQLSLNMIWCPLFFYFHRIDLAFYDIVTLWCSIATTMVVFYPVNYAATLLLLPHFCWISFASCLNLATWRLNGSRGEKAIKTE